MSDGVMTRPPTILEDIQQTKPFKSASQAVILSIIRSADDLKRALAQRLDPYGITMQQYNVLRILRGAGEDGIPTLTIGERMLERTPGVTRLIDRMERKGWVERRRCTRDRRRVWCIITQEGLDLLSPLDDVVDGFDETLTPIFEPGELETLGEYLDRVRAETND